jgi:hypothetical protein
MGTAIARIPHAVSVPLWRGPVSQVACIALSVTGLAINSGGQVCVIPRSFDRR